MVLWFLFGLIFISSGFNQITSGEFVPAIISLVVGALMIRQGARKYKRRNGEKQTSAAQPAPEPVQKPAPVILEAAAPARPPVRAVASAPAPVSALSKDKIDPKDNRAINDLHDFVSIDVETTGRSYIYDRITQFAAAIVEHDQVVDSVSFFVNPGRKIPAEVVRLTGITDEMVAGGLSYAEAAARIVPLLDGKTVLGYNLPFDLAFLEQLLNGAAVSIRTFDVLPYVRRVVPGPENYKLQTMLSWFEIDPGQAHRADSDALTTAQLFQVARSFAKEEKKRLAAERKAAREAEAAARVAQFGASPLLEKRFAFGGEFKAGRTAVEAMVDTVGAILQGSVSGKTDYMVQGPLPNASDPYDLHNLHEAQRQQEKGKPVQIITEDEFLAMIEDARAALAK